MARTQFSLRTLLAAVAVVGIGAALWVAEPSWHVGLLELVLMIWALATALMLSIHSKGLSKAWWIGIVTEWTAVTPFCFISFIAYNEQVIGANAGRGLVWELPLGALHYLAVFMSDYYRPLLLALAFAPVVGLLCVFTHWLLVRPASAEPKD